MKTKNKVKLIYSIRQFIKTLPYHFLVLGSVFICAVIFNKYFEALCYLIAFFSLRYTFPKTYHSDNIVICMSITISMFCLSVAFCPPIYSYILISIVLAYIECGLLWFIKDRQDLYEFKATYTDFKLEIATEQQIINRCKLLHLKKDKIDLAVKFFVYNWSNRQVFDWMCENKLYVEYDTVIKYRYRLAKKLRKFEKNKRESRSGRK